MKNEKKHWTIVTKKGTRWAAQGNNEQEVRDNFFGHCMGIEIAEVQPVRLFTHEEEQELRREKLEYLRYETLPSWMTRDGDTYTISDRD